MIDTVLAVVRFLMGQLVTVLVLSAALTATRSDFADLRKRPHFYLRAVALAAIGIPIITTLVTTVLPVQLHGHGVLLLLAACPGAPILLLRNKHRSRAASINLFLLLAIVSIVLVPLWAWWIRVYFHQDRLLAGPVDILRLLVPKVVLPFVVGVAVHALAPTLAASLGKWMGRLALAVLAIAGVLLLRAGLPLLMELGTLDAVALLAVLCVATAIGHVAGGPAPEDRGAVVQAIVPGNPVLAAAIVIAAYHDTSVTALIAVYFLVRILVVGVYQHWLTSRTERAAVLRTPGSGLQKRT